MLLPRNLVRVCTWIAVLVAISGCPSTPVGDAETEGATKPVTYRAPSTAVYRWTNDGILAEVARSTDQLLAAHSLPREVEQMALAWAAFAKGDLRLSANMMIGNTALDSIIERICPNARRIVQEAADLRHYERGLHVFNQCNFRAFNVLTDAEAARLRLPPIGVWAFHHSLLDAGVPPAAAQSHVRGLIAAWDLRTFDVSVDPKAIRLISYEGEEPLPLPEHSMFRSELQRMISRACWMQSKGDGGFDVTADDTIEVAALLNLVASSECDLDVSLTSTRRKELLDPRRVRFSVVTRAPAEATLLHLEAEVWTLRSDRQTVPEDWSAAVQTLRTAPDGRVTISYSADLTVGAMIDAIFSIQRGVAVDVYVIKADASPE